MYFAFVITDDVSDNLETIAYFAGFSLIVWRLWTARQVDKQTGAELPFDPRRVFRPWRYLEMTGRTLGTVTGVRLIVPSEGLSVLAGMTNRGYARSLWTAEVSFRYLTGDVERDGKFRIVVPMDFSKAERTELSTIHDEDVLVRFDPKQPEDCEPAEHEWHRCKVWTEGA